MCGKFFHLLVREGGGGGGGGRFVVYKNENTTVLYMTSPTGDCGFCVP